MGRSGYLIDSNAVIDFLGNNLPKKGMKFVGEIIDDVPKISVITQIEILGFNGTDQEELVFKSFVSDSEIYNLNTKIINLCIELRKIHKIKLPDALIAATAITHDFTLITRNTADFNSLKSLELINPHKLSKSD